MADGPMWCLVMFDLPVLTKVQRRDASNFRHFLLDRGFSMVQLSVYVKYWPTCGIDMVTIKSIKGALPPGGQVRVIPITDRQWSGGFRFQSATECPVEDEPEQLTIF